MTEVLVLVGLAIVLVLAVLWRRVLREDAALRARCLAVFENAFHGEHPQTTLRQYSSFGFLAFEVQFADRAARDAALARGLKPRFGEAIQAICGEFGPASNRFRWEAAIGFSYVGEIEDLAPYYAAVLAGEATAREPEPATLPLRLFVYGTLAPGRENAHLLADLAGKWHRATARGTLYAEGWGAARGYPGLVPDPAGDDVAGWLLESDALAAHWKRLDAFEGDGYRRVVVTVVLDDGRMVDAQLYALSSREPPA